MVIACGLEFTHLLSCGCRDALQLNECARTLDEARTRDAAARGGGGLQAAQFGAQVANGGEHTLSAWTHVTSGTRPLLHRFLGEGGVAPDVWFERRLAFSTSLAVVRRRSVLVEWSRLRVPTRHAWPMRPAIVIGGQPLTRRRPNRRVGTVAIQANSDRCEYP